MLDIDQTRNNGSAELVVGDSFRLQLGENPTTGYRWHLQRDGAPVLRMVEDSFEASPGGAGGGGTRSWIFAAEQPGAAQLSIELRRSWQPQQPASNFGIAINVKPKPDSR
jgi:inhibitor of cysteine peptidase